VRRKKRKKKEEKEQMRKVCEVRERKKDDLQAEK